MKVIVVKDSPVKDNAASRGANIGFIYGSIEPYPCVVDEKKIIDGYVKMLVPTTWKETGKAGWIEFKHCVEAIAGVPMQYLLTINTDGTASIKRVG